MSICRQPVPGGTFAFTACLSDRQSRLLTDRIGLLRDVVRLTRKQMPFEIECVSVLPSEMHMIWSLPQGDDDFSARWRFLKTTFSRHLDAAPTASAARGATGIWRPGIREKLILDTAEFETRRDAMYHAPVRAGLVMRPEDWPYSSIHHLAEDRVPVAEKEAARHVA